MEPDDAPWRRPDAAASEEKEPDASESPGQAAQRPGPQRRVEPARRFTAAEASPARPAGVPPALVDRTARPTAHTGPTDAGRTDHGPTYPGPTYPGPTYPGPTENGPAYPGLVYQGPPGMQPPPAGWRPEHVITPPPPRPLPEQDHAAIDAEEAHAMALTRAIAIAAGAILLVMMCALCGRLIV